MASQSVARSKGDNAQRRLSVYQRPRHLVDGAVASHSHHDVCALGCRLAGYLSCMSGVFREAHLVVKALLVEVLADELGHFVLVAGSRYGVDDEYDASLVFHFFCKITNSA